MGGQKSSSILWSGNGTISNAIAIIQCKGYGEIMLGYQPTYGLQILCLKINVLMPPYDISKPGATGNHASGVMLAITICDCAHA